MAPEYLIGVDIGTLGCRCSIFDELGNVKGYAYEEYSIETPQNNYAEQNPKTYWNTAIKTIKQTIQASKIAKQDIAAIGLTGIQVSFLPIDSKGRNLGPSIIYADRRSIKQYEWMKKEIGERKIYEITGSKLDPMYPASKLLWIKEEQPEKFKSIFKILSPKDYVGFKLTGEIKMDLAMASTFQLLDIRKKAWSEYLFDMLGLPFEIFPDIIPSTEILGEIDSKVAKAIGLRKDLPVIIGGGDTTCMALGAGSSTEDVLCASLGTTSNVFGCLKKLQLDQKMRVSYYCHVIPERWVVIAGTTDSLILRWYRDNLGHFEVELGKKLKINPYRIIDQEAEKSKPGANGLIFLPFLTGARSPLWNPNATAVLFGLNYHHNREDVTRALLESVAYSIRHRIDVMKELGLHPKEVRIVGGGAKSRLWAQLIADITNIPIITLKSEETAVLGAALLAGIGVGIYKGFKEACEKAVKISDKYSSQTKNREVYDFAFEIYKTLYTALLNVFEKRVLLLEKSTRAS